jgi:hypothetical protein
MAPRHQLRLANILIGVGVLPLTLVLCWTTVFFITTVPGQSPSVPMIDPIGKVGLLIMCMIITFVVAGAATCWSWLLTTRHAEIRSSTALAFRLVTVLVLIAPFLLSYYLSLHGR